MNTNTVKPSWYILPTIVFALFTGTSLWFATNVVVAQLSDLYQLPEGAAADLVSAVQFGFMAGTLLFAFLNISDRIAPRVLFLLCAVSGALLNALILWWADGYWDLMILRGFTGICLAGIYPVAIKTAATWFDAKVLGKAMGYTVGALALGTAFPHLVRYLGADLSASQVIYIVSCLAITGALMMFVLVPNGPYLRPATPFDPKNIVKVFKLNSFKSAAFGYFGHMWELYAFWAVVPVWIAFYSTQESLGLNVSLWSYLVMAIGFIGCVVGGYLTKRWGSRSVAAYNLIASAICCLISPFVLSFGVVPFIALMLFWGFMVLGDSPQFSTLVSKAVPAELIGTAITLMTCVGFTISIFSIQLLSYLQNEIELRYIFLPLLIGPLLGFWALYGFKEKQVRL